MSDPSSLNPPGNGTALTNDLMFHLKASGVRAKNYRCSVLPTNKNLFLPQDTTIIYVPCGRRNSYLNCGSSYMRFTVKNMDATNIIRFDGNAGSLIQRLDIFHGSALLESIIGYNMVTNYILDMQASASQRCGLSSMYGFDTTGDRSGFPINPSAQATFCLPIFSGVIGLLNDKYLPTGWLSDDIRIEITWESAAVGLCAAGGTPTFNIIDFQLELDFCELSDEGEDLTRSYTDPTTEPIYLHGTSWKRYTSSLASGTAGSYATLVPARFASLKQICMLPIRSTEFASATSYSIGSRINPCIDSYYWRIGSSIIPNKPVVLNNINNTGSYSEGFAELLKSWHSLHTVHNTCCLGLEYNVNDVAIANTSVVALQVTGTSYKNGFVIAQELESFAQRSDVLLCGLNTLSSQLFFEANINATGPAAAYSLNFFAWYDHILMIQNGLMSVKF